MLKFSVMDVHQIQLKIVGIVHSRIDLVNMEAKLLLWKQQVQPQVVTVIVKTVIVPVK